MEQLSSCYFCGTALDEPLETYLLGLGRGGPSGSVVLCPSCHQKLETVLEAADVGADSLSPADDAELGGMLDSAAEATAAGDDASPDPTADEPPADGSDDGSEPTATDDGGEHGAAEPVQADTGAAAETAVAEEPWPEADGATEDEPTETGERAASGADAGGDPDTTESESDAGASESEDGDSESDATDPEPDADNTASEADDAVGTGTDAADILVDPESDDSLVESSSTDSGDETLTAEMEADVPDEFEAGEDAETDAVEGASANGTGAATTEDGPSTETGQADSEASSDGNDATPAGNQVSALEYNKVMRLLQNREFPVDRQEIIVVATSAYGLADAECNQVIDLAIDRGLIDEDGDQLLRPD
jgi:hypothetical protein